LSMAATLLRLFLLLVLVAGGTGWTVWADTRSPPDLTNVTTAMAAAYRFPFRTPFLRWALAPDFCSAMNRLLIEEKSTTFFLAARAQNFTSCDRIRSIVRESFDVWSAANPMLHFVDVTDRCAVERLWRPIADERCSESNYCYRMENASELDWKLGLTPLEELPSVERCACAHASMPSPSLSTRLCTF
jgi:hypothetical protein